MHYTFRQFQTDYPNDDVCLDAILAHRHPYCCPSCKSSPSFKRIPKRKAYTCQNCKSQIYPCVGTPFEKSRTPLTLWFHAIYLMTTTRNGVSAKELQRQLGITYKTAWNMGHAIRFLMACDNDNTPGMEGHVELDETFVGGKEKNKHFSKRTKGTQGYGSSKTKAIVFANLQRGGNILTQVVPNTKAETLQPFTNFNVIKGTTISTDEHSGYNNLTERGYLHGVVKHAEKQYVKGIHHVNAVEGFWKHLKCGIVSTHVSVSHQHLQKYADEFSFRYNNRHNPADMFKKILSTLDYLHTE